MSDLVIKRVTYLEGEVGFFRLVQQDDLGIINITRDLISYSGKRHSLAIRKSSVICICVGRTALWDSNQRVKVLYHDKGILSRASFTTTMRSKATNQAIIAALAGFEYPNVSAGDEDLNLIAAKFLTKDETQVNTNRKKTAILFLASNPLDTTRLRLDEESRLIGRALKESPSGESFEITQEWAVQVSDIQDHFLRHRPSIVHFSGHGNSKSEIALQDEQGRTKTVAPSAIAELFLLLGSDIQCVVLNACYSEAQAEAIAHSVECVIGVPGPLSDSAALNFSQAFYRALGYGSDLETAFRLGCNQIALVGLDQRQMPRLIAPRGHPRDIVFV